MSHSLRIWLSLWLISSLSEAYISLNFKTVQKFVELVELKILMTKIEANSFVFRVLLNLKLGTLSAIF